MRQHRELQQSDYGGWGTVWLHGAQKPRCAMQCGSTHRFMRRRTARGRGLQPRSLQPCTLLTSHMSPSTERVTDCQLQSSHENSTDFRGLKMLPLPRLPTPLNTAFRGPASAGPAAGLTSLLYNAKSAISVQLLHGIWVSSHYR